MSTWKEENLGPESRKAHPRRSRDGFFDRYFGGVVLDIGYRGYEDVDVVPVLPDAIGIDLNYPGYDGKRLPFEEATVDTVYASHTLEHIDDPVQAIQEWFRVLKIGGYLVLAVPHQFLYEKRVANPSRWNEDHKRFYTPATLLGEVEASLAPNTYRVRHLMDDDEFYDYAIPPQEHAGGAYQIELVIQKLLPPTWGLEASPGSAPASDPVPNLDADLGRIFETLEGAAGPMAEEQDRQLQRVLGLHGRLNRGRVELERLIVAPAPLVPGRLETYLRPGAVPVAEITTTTRFFRNRRQLQTLLRQLRPNGEAHPRILVVGVSRGCEAYSLAIEADNLGRPVEITAVDIDPANIEVARTGLYDPEDFVDFDGTPLLDAALANYFQNKGGQITLRPKALKVEPLFQIQDLFLQEGLFDAIVCNNVLIHFSDTVAEQALAKLVNLLDAGGVLAVGGVSLDVLSGFVKDSPGFSPIEENLEAIWEDWKGDRLTWEQNPGAYVGMPPLDRTLPDWPSRFSTLFRKQQSLGTGSSPDLAALPTWVAMLQGELDQIAIVERNLRDSAIALDAYLIELLGHG